MTTEAPSDPGATGSVAPNPAPMSDRAQKRIGAAFLITFFLANLGLWVATLTPVIVTLPLKVATIDPDPSTRAVTLSVVLISGSLIGILANPVVGRLSDRTTSRFGMRRPWLLIGSGLALAGMTIVGLADTTGLVIIGWILGQVGVNAMMSVLIALVPDHVPEAKRGMVSGFLGVAQAAGAMLGTGLAFGLTQVSLTIALIVPPAIAFAFMVLACTVLADRRLAAADRPPFDIRAFVTSFWVNPRRHPDFGWAWWSRFALFMAISMVMNYQLYFLIAQVGLTELEATAVIPIAIAVQTVLVTVVSLVFGPLSDRLRRRKLFVSVSALIAAVGLGTAAVSTTVPMFLGAIALIAIGQGVYFAVDLALVTDILPDREHDAAKDMGVFNLAQLIPQSVAPAIAPAFLIIPTLSISGRSGENYTMLFLGGAVFAVLAGVTIWRVRGVR